MSSHWERRAGELLWSCVKESLACRECRGSVNPLVKVCAHCGAFHPVKFPISTSVATTFLISMAMIALLRFA